MLWINHCYVSELSFLFQENRIYFIIWQSKINLTIYFNCFNKISFVLYSVFIQGTAFIIIKLTLSTINSADREHNKKLNEVTKLTYLWCVFHVTFSYRKSWYDQHWRQFLGAQLIDWITFVHLKTISIVIFYLRKVLKMRSQWSTFLKSFNCIKVEDNNLASISYMLCFIILYILIKYCTPIYTIYMQPKYCFYTWYYCRLN